jgi:hypothetical protein
MPQEGVCQWKSILDELKALQKQSGDTQLCMHHKSKRMSKEQGTAVRMQTRATIEDLYKVERKAELVNGEIVELPPSGDEPSSAGFEIATSLKTYARRSGRARAYPDGTGFHVNLPHREPLSPDSRLSCRVAYRRRFLEGSPIFAVEVRSENDYGLAAALKPKPTVMMPRGESTKRSTLSREEVSSGKMLRWTGPDDHRSL